MPIRPKKTPTKAKVGKPKSVSVNMEVDYEALMQDAKDARGGAFMKLQDGKNVLRPIPYFSESAKRMKLFAKQSRHFGIHPTQRVVDCGGKNCPICALRNMGDVDKETAKVLRPNERFLINVVDRNDPSNQIQVLAASFRVFADIQAVVEDSKDYPKALDLKSGFDFNIKKSGTGLSTSYSVQVLPKRTKVTPEGTAHDLDEMARSKSSPTDLERLADEIAEHLGITS